MADKTQRNKDRKGKKPGQFKKTKRRSQLDRKGIACPQATIAEQITQSKNKDKDQGS